MQRKLASPFARLAITVVVTAAVVCAGAAARAQTSRPPIVLVLDPCAAVDANEVRRLVPIEMGAPLAAGATAEASPDATPADTTHVFVGCVPGSPQLVRLEVRDPESGRHVDRVITLVGESKTDQARLVAIVAVELVAASRTELREAPPAPVATPDAHALAVTARPAPVPEPPVARWRALALGSLRHIQGLPRVLPGGGLGYVTSAVAGHVEGHPDVAVSGAWWNVVLGVGFVP